MAKPVMVTVMHMIRNGLILLAACAAGDAAAAGAAAGAGTKLTDIKSAFSADSAVSASPRGQIFASPPPPLR